MTNQRETRKYEGGYRQTRKVSSNFPQVPVHLNAWTTDSQNARKDSYSIFSRRRQAGIVVENPETPYQSTQGGGLSSSTEWVDGGLLGTYRHREAEDQSVDLMIKTWPTPQSKSGPWRWSSVPSLPPLAAIVPSIGEHLLLLSNMTSIQKLQEPSDSPYSVSFFSGASNVIVNGRQFTVGDGRKSDGEFDVKILVPGPTTVHLPTGTSHCDKKHTMAVDIKCTQQKALGGS